MTEYKEASSVSCVARPIDRWIALIAVLPLGLFVSLLLGCGGGVDLGPFGTVAGKVTYEGQPVTEGVISFNCPQSGQAATAPLQADGTYRMQLGDRDGLPVGEYNVYVRPPFPDYKERVARHDLDWRPESKPKTYPNIPEHYRSETTSKLTATIIEGHNPLDYDMTAE